MVSIALGWPVVLYCVAISQNTYFLEDRALSDLFCDPQVDACSV